MRFRESTFELERPKFSFIREILERELPTLQAEAEAGHPGAMLKLAIVHAQEHIVPTNQDLSKFWLQKVPGDYKTEYGLTAIIVAAAFGFLEVLKFKVDEGADVNARTIDGVTALVAASVNGQGASVDYLVTIGADLSAPTSNGDTALIAASLRGHVEIVEYLLQKGCDTDEVNSQGTTAPMAACAEGHLDIARQLCANGASAGLTNFDGYSALELAKEGKAILKLWISTRSHWPATYLMHRAILDSSNCKANWKGELCADGTIKPATAGVAACPHFDVSCHTRAE